MEFCPRATKIGRQKKKMISQYNFEVEIITNKEIDKKKSTNII